MEARALATEQEKRKIEELAKKIGPKLVEIQKTVKEYGEHGSVYLYGDGVSIKFYQSGWSIRTNSKGEIELEYSYRESIQDGDQESEVGLEE